MWSDTRRQELETKVKGKSWMGTSKEKGWRRKPKAENQRWKSKAKTRR
jgi:hypothetical protein